jgi:hypothetical protein
VPFIPYITEFALHYNDKVAGFELEKKLLFFIAPIVLGLFMAMFRPGSIRHFMSSFFLSLTALTLYSIALLWYRGVLFSTGSYTNGDFNLRHSFEDITHLHPTYYSLFACVAILWLIYDYHNQRTLYRAIYIAAAIILFGGQILLASKMPLAALLVSGCFLLYKLIENKKKLLLVYALILPCAAALPFVLPSLNSRMIEVRTFVQPLPSHPDTKNDRRVIFDCGTETFLNNIWLGTGARNSQTILTACYLDKGLFKAASEPFNAHNQFLTLGINYGVFIMLPFILILIVFVKKALFDPFAIAMIASTIMVMCTESILERQWGVYFFVLFYLLLSNVKPKGSIAETGAF